MSWVARIVVAASLAGLALYYALGVWRSWKLGKYDWRARRPIVFSYAMACAVFAVGTLIWVAYLALQP